MSTLVKFLEGVNVEGPLSADSRKGDGIVCYGYVVDIAFGVYRIGGVKTDEPCILVKSYGIFTASRSLDKGKTLSDVFGIVYGDSSSRSSRGVALLVVEPYVETAVKKVLCQSVEVCKMLIVVNEAVVEGDVCDYSALVLIFYAVDIGYFTVCMKTRILRGGVMLESVPLIFA